MDQAEIKEMVRARYGSIAAAARPLGMLRTGGFVLLRAFDRVPG